MISESEARRRQLGVFRGMAVLVIPSVLAWALIISLLVSHIH